MKDRIIDFRRVKASEILRNPKNWRTHPESQKDAMKGILAEVGIADALIARETEDGLMLIDGHLRTDLDDDTEWPVLILDVNEQEADTILATHDPLAAMAGVSKKFLAELITDLEVSDNNLQTMLNNLGKDLDLFPSPEIVEDDVPPIPKNPITKSGDLWILGNHRLLCGDSTKSGDVERLMGGEKADLCFTSPPYTDQRTYHGADLSIENLCQFLPLAFTVCSVVCVNLGISRKDGAIVRYWDDYIEASEKVGARLLSWNIWDRGKPYSVGQQTAVFPIEHEFVFVFAIGPVKLIPTIRNETSEKRKTYRNRGKDGKLSKQKGTVVRKFRELGTIWRGNPVNDNSDHPAQFPIRFPMSYISSFNDDVYDPFLGSGTTLIAAEQLNRQCYGIEISPQYCDVIIERWENFSGGKAIRQGSNGAPRKRKVRKKTKKKTDKAKS